MKTAPQIIRELKRRLASKRALARVYRDEGLNELAQHIDNQVRNMQSLLLWIES